MSEENKELEVSTPEVENEEMFSKGDVERRVKARLKQSQDAARRKQDEYEARIAELENKIESSSAVKSQGAESGAAQGEPAYNDGQVKFMMKKQKEIDKYNDKVKDALDKDEEFKKLSESGNPIAPELQMYMTHLDNAPAVLKHLLKDGKDHRLMESIAMSRDEAAFIKFVNDVSDKLEQKSGKPTTPDYKPSANISDVGESGQDFDVSEYVKNKC